MVHLLFNHKFSDTIGS